MRDVGGALVCAALMVALMGGLATAKPSSAVSRPSGSRPAATPSAPNWQQAWAPWQSWKRVVEKEGRAYRPNPALRGPGEPDVTEDGLAELWVDEGRVVQMSSSRTNLLADEDGALAYASTLTAGPSGESNAQWARVGEGWLKQGPIGVVWVGALDKGLSERWAQWLKLAQPYLASQGVSLR